MKIKPTKKKGTQIGNFIVIFETGELKSVKITSVAGNWNIRYRQDNLLYSWIAASIKTEEGCETLHLAFSCWYAACNGIPDPQFLEEIVNSYTNSVERMRVGMKKLSDTEDKEIIDDMRANHLPD